MRIFYVSLKKINYLLEEQPFHKLETLFGQAELTNLPYFSEGFSWSYEALGISKSQPGLLLPFLEVCTAHWLTVQLCTEKQTKTHKE